MNGWTRVTKENPCGICGKPDWCCLGDKWWNCMRIVSDNPCHNGGWLHPLDAKAKEIPRREPAPEIVIDAKAIMIGFIKETKPEFVARLAADLQVKPEALHSLGCAWAERYRAWAFPMFNGSRQCIGIRLRASTGKKWAVRGSKQGLFIPRMAHNGLALICEGPTDTAAAVSLGYFAIGRPSCNGCIVETQRCLRENQIHKAVVVTDTDRVGLDSAQFFADNLGVKTCFIVPMAKDFREFVKMGATKELIDSWIASSVWLTPEHHAQQPDRTLRDVKTKSQ